MFRRLLWAQLLSLASVVAADAIGNPELLSPSDASWHDPARSTAESGGSGLPPEDAQARQGGLSEIQMEHVEQLREESQSLAQEFQKEHVEQLMKESQTLAQEFQKELDENPAVATEQSPTAPTSQAATSLRPVLMHQRSLRQRLTHKPHADDIRNTRPGDKSGEVDNVTFAIFAKNFFGTNLKDNTFTIDAVMQLKWKDKRAASIIPSGMDEITMSGKQALFSIWMPEIVVTNRAIRKHEVVSSAVTIAKDGNITKVERFGATINNLYDLVEYPFDTQKLFIKIASSKYMLSEVRMEPDKDKSESGVRKGLFDGFDYELKGFKLHAFDEADGALKKSRGVLEIEAKRIMIGKYFEDHVTPTALLIMISWGVFYFPFQNPFITPRLALSILTLLTFTNFAIKSASLLPNGIPTTWNDVFNQQVQALMFCTIVINIFSEVCKHQYELNALGIAVNNEAKIIMPVLTIILLTLVISAGIEKWLAIGVTTIVAKTLLAVVMTIYFSYNFSLLQAQNAEKKAAVEEKKSAEERQRLGAVPKSNV